MTDIAVELAGVSRRFGSVKAVDNVSLTIAQGEFFAMLGPSGSGKTTCLRLIAGFEQPDAGSISIFGARADGLPPYRRDVNTVFQDYALFPHMTVGENVAYGLMIRGVNRAEREAKARAALAMVKLDDYGTRRPAQLSGGQRQRVALARALVNEPKVLLLDEPLGALDLKLREQMQAELKELQRRLGITFIFVTHDQGEALAMADRVAVFNAGRILQAGSPADIYERPASPFVADFVGSSNVLAPDFAKKLGGTWAWTSLRPERIQVHTGPRKAYGADETGADGVIRGVHYQGSVTRLSVEIPGNRLVASVAVSDERYEEGQSVQLSWARASMRPMADET
jgi:putative spermidine/putrescine transport system ATP-binding protein